MSETAKKVASPITPLGDRVVVRPLTEDEMGTTSPSGIIIPDTVKNEKPEQGVVVAVGPGRYVEGSDTRTPVEVKEGDQIVFSKFGFDEVKVENNEYYIVSEGSILGIIK